MWEMNVWIEFLFRILKIARKCCSNLHNYRSDPSGLRYNGFKRFMLNNHRENWVFGA